MPSVQQQTEAVIAFILAEVGAGRPFPSRPAIQAHMRWKDPDEVDSALYRLWHAGYLSRSSRGYALAYAKAPPP